MKRTLLVLTLFVALVATLVGCGSEKETPQAALGTADNPVKIGVTAGPHAIVLDFVKDEAAKNDFHIKVVEFSDFVTPNVSLVNGDLDMTSHQHKPYMDNFNAGQDNQLVGTETTLLLPMAIFSERYDSLDAIPDGAQVAIPNDPSNGGRALLVLQDAGFIELRDGGGVDSTPSDIVGNPKNLEFLELDAAQIPRSLADTDFSVVNANYAVEIGMNPVEDALFVESIDSPYACLLVVRKDDQDNPAYAKVAEFYQTESVRNFVNEEFKGSILPAF